MVCLTRGREKGGSFRLKPQIKISPTSEAMPKAAKERAKHSTSLAAQIQNDKDPQVSVSKRAKMKRKAQDEVEAEQSGEQVIEGKLGRQILMMAREQMDDEDDEDDSEQENETKWREAQV